MAMSRLLEGYILAEYANGPKTLALYTSNPGELGAGVEVSGPGYSRKPITLTTGALPSGKPYVYNATDITFTMATGDWGVVTHLGLFEGGQLYWYAPLSRPQRLGNGDYIIFLENDLQITVD